MSTNPTHARIKGSPFNRNHWLRLCPLPRSAR
jgi:hypothetical protein